MVKTWEVDGACCKITGYEVTLLHCYIVTITGGNTVDRKALWREEDYYSRALFSKKGTVEQKIAKTLVASVRYRPSVAATILQFLIEHGERPTTISDVIKLSLECFSEMISSTESRFLVSSETEGIELLKTMGILSNASKRNLSRVHGILSLDSLRETQSETQQSEIDAAAQQFYMNKVNSGDVKPEQDVLERFGLEMVEGKCVKKTQVWFQTTKQRDGEYDANEMRKMVEQMKANQTPDAI